MKYAVIAGRILFAAIFIFSSLGHFKAETIAYAAFKGVPMASVLVPLSGLIELVAGLSILVGYRARIGGWLLVLFLVPVTLTFHRFWTIDDPMVRQLDMVNFLKNLSMMGAALMISYFGSGEFSIDKVLANRKHQFATRPA